MNKHLAQLKQLGGDPLALIFRENFVRIEPLPDDFRGCPIDWNLRQHLVIPDVAREPSRLGKVVALGSGKMQNGERWQFTVKPGDIVLSSRYPKSCQNFKMHGEEIILVREDELLAVVNS
jgi:chaperonin GroES